MSAAQAKRLPQGTMTRNYRMSFSSLWLVDVQTNVDTRLNAMRITIGQKIYTNVMVKCPILYVIGDTLGLDMFLCGQYKAYNYCTCN